MKNPWIAAVFVINTFLAYDGYMEAKAINAAR